MPNGIYPISTSPPTHAKAASRSQAPAGLRLRTWWRRDRLDAALAKGTDPRTSAELTLRAERLASRPVRDRMAENLEGALREALQPAKIGRLLLRRRQAQACADELLALARRLRDDEPIDLRGAAMTALLLTNGRGPLYYERASVPLRQAVRSARLALDGDDQAAHPIFPAAA